MLGGGYYRGASVPITGFPGTAKTTLSGAFADAACLCGERTMCVGFDSDGTEVIRNLNSVGIKLGRHVKSGFLQEFDGSSFSLGYAVEFAHKTFLCRMILAPILPRSLNS